MQRFVCMFDGNAFASAIVNYDDTGFVVFRFAGTIQTREKACLEFHYVSYF
ncbi:MAG: hypothetical protein KDB27_22375 [Planctomycetales bacterium]|nr:hypothetical protein [Planctomycetales bacterium]